MKKNKGLFLSHLDDRSGAPKALYSILKFILTHCQLNVDVFVCRPKDNGYFENLKNELNQNSKFEVYYQKSKKKSKIFLINKLYKLSQKIMANTAAKKVISDYNKNYDFIFFNSISYIYHKTDLDKITIPKYLYLHEGSIFLASYINDDYAVFNMFEHIFVPSNQVEKDLINRGIAASKISIMQLFLNENEINKSDRYITNNEELVVGNLAYLHSGKGIEYFLATAKLYKELHPNDKIIFKWKGCPPESQLFKLTNCEIENSGLKNVVFLEPFGADINEFLSAVDVLMMTSKQETFGYVVLEAANNHVPSIAFDQVIGASQFIKEYGGLVADYLSISQLVDCLKKYYQDRNLLAQHGINANNHLKANYSYNINTVNDLKSKLAIFIN